MVKLPLNKKYQEILKLHQMLSDALIPHITERFFDGWRVCYLVRREEGRDCVCDAIEHFGSFGKEQDKLEIMGLLTLEEKKHDSVVGYLTAEDVFARIKAHWEKSGGKV